jgi:hypothetical protein
LRFGSQGRLRETLHCKQRNDKENEQAPGRGTW